MSVGSESLGVGSILGVFIISMVPRLVVSIISIVVSLSIRLSLGFSFSLPNETPLTKEGRVVAVVVERVVTVVVERVVTVVVVISGVGITRITIAHGRGVVAVSTVEVVVIL